MSGRELWDIVSTILGHIVVLTVLILGAWGLHHLLEWLGDPKLFDFVPLRYLIDASDVGLALSFAVYGTMSFIGVVQDHREPPMVTRDQEHKS